MKLKSMIDYVLERTEDLGAAPESLFREELENVKRYANFLNSEFRPEMLAQFNGSTEEQIIFKSFEVSEDKEEKCFVFKCNNFEFNYYPEDGMFSSFIYEDMHLGTIEDFHRFADNCLEELHLNENGLMLIEWN